MGFIGRINRPIMIAEIMLEWWVIIANLISKSFLQTTRISFAYRIIPNIPSQVFIPSFKLNWVFTNPHANGWIKHLSLPD